MTTFADSNEQPCFSSHRLNSALVTVRAYNRCVELARRRYNGRVLIDVTVMAAFLLAGNILFHHFDPFLPLSRRIIKTAAALAATAIVSHYLGHIGVVILFGIILVPLIYVHGIWLPRNGVNGWTGEPREKYYALRGWTSTGSPQSKQHE